MIAVPADPPNTLPVLPLTVTLPLMLLQVPPVVVLFSVTDEPVHTIDAPVIGVTAVTVTIVLA